MHGSGSAAHAYLDGARRAWVEHPDWMDFVAPGSPAWDLKRASRDLYLHEWQEALDRAASVLDVGCGVGRFVVGLLDRGKDVFGVDADLESLRRCAWHAAGRAGRLDLSWSSVHVLPDVRVDAVIACEVLCYVPHHADALRAMLARLRPGGALLLSVEARWGWATAEDAPQDGLRAALEGTPVLDVPDDRWVRTWEAGPLRAWLEDAGLEVQRLVPTHYTLDGPLERVLPPEPTLEVLLDAEAACRDHPVWRSLNRIHTVVARKR